MQTVALNMVPNGVNPIAYASQYDTARVVRFPLLNGAPDDQYSLSGYETLSVKLTKPDGSEVTFNVPNPGAGKTYVDVTFPYEACNQAGVCLGELRMESPGIWDFGSLNFILKVEADPYGDDITTDTATGNPCTFETNLTDTLVSLGADIVATQASGTPSPDNPLPISGISSLDIVRCGVNQWDEEWESGAFDGSTGVPVDNPDWSRSKNPILVNGSTSYYCNFNGIDGTHYAYAVFFDINGTYIDKQYLQAKVSITTPANCRYMKVQYKYPIANIGDYDVSINYPSSDTEYHAYKGQTFTIDFSDL